MDLPLEIPKDLRACGIPVNPESDDEIVWKHPDALRVVDALRGTKVAVLEIVVYRSQSWGFVPTDTSWSCEPDLGETATDFATRSQDGARDFVKSRPGGAEQEEFYTMALSNQDAAA